MFSGSHDAGRSAADAELNARVRSANPLNDALFKEALIKSEFILFKKAPSGAM